ncbi:unnamed protein product, partial [Adineta ricciae]
MHTFNNLTFQCAQTTCLPFDNLITAKIYLCRIACLEEVRCEAATYYQLTSICSLFNGTIDPNRNMSYAVNVVTMINIPGTRFPLKPTTVSSTTSTSSTTTAPPTWTITGSMTVARRYHTLSVLSDGRVLATGGTNGADAPLKSAELYDPLTGNWTITGSMSTTRYYHRASVLPNGKVLVTGGQTA